MKYIRRPDLQCIISRSSASAQQEQNRTEQARSESIHPTPRRRVRTPSPPANKGKAHAGQRRPRARLKKALAIARHAMPRHAPESPGTRARLHACSGLSTPHHSTLRKCTSLNLTARSVCGRVYDKPISPRPRTRSPPPAPRFSRTHTRRQAGWERAPGGRALGAFRVRRRCAAMHVDGGRLLARTL